MFSWFNIILVFCYLPDVQLQSATKNNILWFILLELWDYCRGLLGICVYKIVERKRCFLSFYSMLKPHLHHQCLGRVNSPALTQFVENHPKYNSSAYDSPIWLCNIPLWRWSDYLSDSHWFEKKKRVWKKVIFFNSHFCLVSQGGCYSKWSPTKILWSLLLELLDYCGGTMRATCVQNIGTYARFIVLLLQFTVVLIY